MEKDKLTRKRTDWKKALRDLVEETGRSCFDEDFWLMKTKHPKMSDNRIAYNVLRRYFNKQAMLRYRIVGEFL